MHQRPRSGRARRWARCSAATGTRSPGSPRCANRWTKRVRLLARIWCSFATAADARPGRRALPASPRLARLRNSGADGIRCPYHGWHFDHAGRCLDQPNEPAEQHVQGQGARRRRYPVEELGGLLLRLSRPAPAPLLPRWDGLSPTAPSAPSARSSYRATGCRSWRTRSIPCTRNGCTASCYELVEEQSDGPRSRWRPPPRPDRVRRVRATASYKRRLMEGQSEDADDWRVGHPVMFPNTLAVGSGGGLWTVYAFQIRVPMDDTHTMHYWYRAYVPPAGRGVPRHLLREAPYGLRAADADDRGERASTTSMRRMSWPG